MAASVCRLIPATCSKCGSSPHNNEASHLASSATGRPVICALCGDEKYPRSLLISALSRRVSASCSANPILTTGAKKSPEVKQISKRKMAQVLYWPGRSASGLGMVSPSTNAAIKCSINQGALRSSTLLVLVQRTRPGPLRALIKAALCDAVMFFEQGDSFVM